MTLSLSLTSTPALSLSLTSTPRLFPSLTPPPLLRRRPAAPARATAARATVSAVAATTAEEEEAAAAAEKIGARVRVTAELKVFHVAKAPEIVLTGREGRLKQYVAAWKGKRISANLPFKVEFVADVAGRGNVKFFAHLKEDEFEYLD